MKDAEVTEGLKRLRGETPSGRVFDEHYQLIGSDKPPPPQQIRIPRPFGWRTRSFP